MISFNGVCRNLFQSCLGASVQRRTSGKGIYEGPPPASYITSPAPLNPPLVLKW